MDSRSSGSWGVLSLRRLQLAVSAKPQGSHPELCPPAIFRELGAAYEWGLEGR